MRIIAAALVFALTACSPPNGAADASSASATTEASTTSAAAAPAFAVTAAQLGGQWSFDRSCGLYDLVFTNDSVTYYDYSDQSNAVGYEGPYTIAGTRVVITVRRLDAQGAPSGDPITYNLDLTAPVMTDLVGRFGPAGGAMREINAKQCALEDRE